MIRTAKGFRYASNPAEHIAIKLVSLNIISIVVLLSALMFGAIRGDELFKELAETSSTIASFKGMYTHLFILLLAPSILALLVSNYLYLKKTHIFIFCLTLLFATTEVAIPFFSQYTIFARYLLLLTIVSGGICALPSYLGKMQMQQTFGLLMLVFVILHLMVDGITNMSASMFPVQIAVFMGLLVGMPAVIKETSVLDIMKFIALAGVCVTFVHLSSFYMASEPFLAGRFRSYLPLPTNFANGYVLMLMAMIWMGMYSAKFYIKIIYFVVSAAGVYLIYISGTRNALVTLIIGLMLFCTIWRRAYFAYLISAVIILFAAYYAFDLGSDRISETGARLAHVSKTETRFAVWGRALDYISNRPYWGYGLDVNMSELDSKLPEWEKFNTHNAYLGIWLRLGLFGMLIVFSIYAQSFVYGYKVFFKRASKKVFADIAILPLCYLVMIFAAGLFEENLSSKGNIQQILFGFSVAVLIVIGKKYKSNAAIPRRRLDDPSITVDMDSY